ncbi:MAG: murein hydrolase activator EnvC family protein [Candidatus Aminicenantia bacterium]
MEPIITYSGISIEEKKGELPWPLEGQIIQRFGLVKNKKYNTVVKNNGIVISPKTDEVKAIWWGKVIFADYFEGYGNVVIIEHQDRIYSIYGYLGTIFVKKGEQINTGQPIAKVGSSGLVAEGAIYFEIREGNDPEDPLLWLSKK